MLVFRDMLPEDRAMALSMMEEFYHTDAVCTPAPRAVMERNVDAALDVKNPALRGVVAERESHPVGYFMLTTFHSGEVGGEAVMIEQIFVSAAARGMGLGGAMLTWLQGDYPQAHRFQLEVNGDNPAAIHLYEKTGFQWNPYGSMVLDTGL